MSNLKRLFKAHIFVLILLMATACKPTSSAHKVDVDGYQLAYQCFGEGTPTVIVEAGLGEAPTDSLNWMTVVEEIQTITRICIYDRAGVGQSDAAPTPRSSMDMAQDLHVLVDTIPLPGPLILVAHSIGGFHVRVFAHLYPQDVAGVILVDSSHPDMFEEIANAFPTAFPNEEPAIATQRPSYQNVPPPSANVEGLDLTASIEQVHNAGTLGATPLIVISRKSSPDVWNIAGLSEADKKRLSDVHQMLQADLAALSSDSTYVIAQTAGHNIHIDEPQIIIDAIDRMVQAIQNQ